MLSLKPRVPLPPECARLPFSKPDTSEEDGAAWLESIKRQARENVQGGYSSVRVAWQHRWKKPRYDRFDDYTPEEAALELWEQFYFENPKSVELAGIFKRKNPKTGLTYYRTGDPELDQLEEAFGRGEFPDMDVLACPDGADIWRRPVFVHDKKNIAAPEGSTVAPVVGFQGVKENEKGEKINPVTGGKIHGTDFTSDDWLKNFEEDEFLKKFATKQGLTQDG